MAYLQKSVSGNPYRNNGGAAILFGAAATGAKITKGIQSESVMDVPGTRWNTGMDAKKAVSGHTLPGAVTTIAMAYTTTIAGATNRNLLGGQNARVRTSIHFKETIRTVKMRTAGWNYNTGAFLTAPTSQVDTYESIDNSSNIDQSSRSSLSVPGEFVTNLGSTPIYNDYKARTVG